MPPDEHDRLRALEDTHWWYGVLHWLVMREIEVLPRGAKVLDVGCGTGGVLAKVDRWDAQGIDVSPHAIRHCRQRGLRAVQVASVHDLPFDDASFDLVLCLDVLYHQSVDEDLALRQMTRVLRPGGRLVFNVPAFDFLRGEHDDRVCGARRYTASHMRRLLEKHSLSPMMLHYWNAWLVLPLLLRRRWGRSTGSDLHPLPRWLNALLRIGGRLDAAMDRWFRVPIGSSVFGYACKAGSTGCLQTAPILPGDLIPSTELGRASPCSAFTSVAPISHD